MKSLGAFLPDGTSLEAIYKGVVLGRRAEA